MKMVIVDPVPPHAVSASVKSVAFAASAVASVMNEPRLAQGAGSLHTTCTWLPPWSMQLPIPDCTLGAPRKQGVLLVPISSRQVLEEGKQQSGRIAPHI